MSADASGSSQTAAGSKRSLPGAAADADAERRVQPRHFHDGPNPTAAADAAAASSTGAAGGPPPISRLYRHALESIFAFLESGELAAALRVSKEWLAAAESMASLQGCHSNPASLQLRLIVESAMARHFTALGEVGKWDRLALNADSLSILARRMAHVTSLNSQLSLSPATSGPHTFPAALKKLNLDVQAPVTAAQVNSLIQGVGRLPLLESFTIRLPAGDAQISFAPLAALPQLRNLSIRWTAGGDHSDAQVDELRSMPNLRRLQTQLMTAPLLRRLLRRPHSLQWQAIDWLWDLDDETAQCLPLLPSLTELGGWVMCTRFDWLQRLTNLTAVHFVSRQIELEAAQIDWFLAGLRHSTNLRQLALTNFNHLTAAHLAALLPRLPQLHTLRLVGLQIDSLSFLSQEPTAQRLTHLELRECTRLPLAELRHVRALRGLESLIIERSFNERMDSLCQSMHTPPAAALPKLKTFIYVQQ